MIGIKIPFDPPRRRANKRRGHGSYENDRPPIVGSVGRETGEVRLRVERHTDQKTLVGHVHGYTAIEATLYTDEWRAYEQVERDHQPVSHGVREWARDDDGDGIREVHVNTIEGLWTSVRNFLRGRSEGYTRSIWEATWRCVSSRSTSNALGPLLSPHSSPCTLCKHEPNVLERLPSCVSPSGLPKGSARGRASLGWPPRSAPYFGSRKRPASGP